MATEPYFPGTNPQGLFDRQNVNLSITTQAGMGCGLDQADNCWHQVISTKNIQLRNSMQIMNHLLCWM